jgi:hypothetical protein
MRECCMIPVARSHKPARTETRRTSPCLTDGLCMNTARNTCASMARFFWVEDEDAEENPVEGFESDDARLAYTLAVESCRWKERPIAEVVS